MKASLTLQRNVYAKRDIWAVKKMSFTGKYIAKMFSLKKFLANECIFKLVCFCESCRESWIYFT